MAENTIIHEISLAGYKATSTGGMLDLGTWGSYGIEKLHLTLDAAWQDLTITAFFNVNGEVVAKKVVGKDGYADVPWEATKENTFAGCLAFEGSINGQRRISTNLNYKVTNHSETTDSDPVPTEDRWNQFVTETKEYRDGAFEAAERANARAEDAETASEDAQAAARAAKASENAAKVSENAAAASEANARISAGAAAVSEGNAAASADKAKASETAVAESASKAAADAAKAASAAKKAADESAAAAGSAAQAEAQKTAAAKSASDAQGYMQTASGAATVANVSAENAAGSKAAAGNFASAAEESKQAAGASEVKAAASEQAAKASEQAAEKVLDDAKTAQKGTEAARDAAAKSAEAAAKSEANAKQSADTLAESVKNVAANTAAVAELREKKAEIDDTAVGADAWSSKHIIDMLCPPLEESGNPVVCYPVAGYPLGVKAKWEPMQEGSGTPYPAGGGKQLLDTNKCVPTVGKPYGMTITLDGDVFKVSGVPNEEVTATEFYFFAVCTCSQEELRGKGYKVTAWAIKGKVNNAWGLRTESENSLAIAAELTPGVNNDIQLRLMVSKDTPTAWEPYENIRPIKGRDSVKVERCGGNLIDSARVTEVIAPYGLTAQYVSGKITISGIYSKSSANASFTFMSLSYKLPPTTKLMHLGLKTSGCTLRGIRFTNKERDEIAIDLSGLTTGEKAEISFYLIAYVGTTAPTTYTPYIGQTNTLTLPETVYGGEVDAVTGEGQETQKLVILNGTESWNSWGINAHNPAITGFYTYDINDYDAKNAKGICSHLETPSQDVWGGRNAGIGFATVGSSRYFMFSMLTSSLPDISAGHEVASLKAYLAAQSDAGTPVQIAYKLAEPVPFTATGAQPLSALAGANTVLTDADSATVTGRADPIKRITDLEDAVASQT